MSFNLTNANIATAQVVDYIVNGYVIEKMGAGEWACVKQGEKRGLCFKSKKAAIAYANAA